MLTFGGRVTIIPQGTLNFNERFEIAGEWVDGIAAGSLHAAGGVMAAIPKTSAAGQNIWFVASNLPPGVVGVISLSATLRYTEVVLLNRRATGCDVTVTTTGRSVSNSIVTVGSFQQSANARRDLERSLMRIARGIALQNGSFWGTLGNQIPAHPNRTVR